MSEEEIIKNLEEFLKGPCEICKYCDGAIRNHRKAIQGLLDLYQKEKEKNKELEEENNKFYNGELYTAKQLKNYEKTIKTYWVNKKIIKEKADDYENKGYIEIAGAMRELLEERN